MRVAMTGSSGLVGTSLSAALRERGHEPVSLLRPGSRSTEGIPLSSEGVKPADALSGFDAVVHLAGESVGARRWSAAQKDRIMRSRIDGMRALVGALRAASPAPAVVISASAVGYFGDGGDRELGDDDPPGSGFLAEVCKAWEQAARTAADVAGVRVVILRFGFVFAAHAPALTRMIRPLRLGVGGRLGSGEQYLSWVHIDDLVGALFHVLGRADLEGAFNLTAPSPCTNAELTEILGRILHRPTLLPVPAFALRLVLGELADPIVLQGQRALPRRLLASGYEFRFSAAEDALRDVLARPTPSDAR